MITFVMDVLVPYQPVEMDALLNLAQPKLLPMVGGIRFEEHKMIISFVDGNELPVPLAWYPKLYYASPRQLSQWQVMNTGNNIRWPELDETIAVNELIS